jgi:hypothetical protein
MNGVRTEDSEREKNFKIVRELAENIKDNFDRDYHIDEPTKRLYVYPDGIKNQRESITINYLGEDGGKGLISMSGHGEKTTASFVCEAKLENMFYCLFDIIAKFRKDNEWDFIMPCENKKAI